MPPLARSIDPKSCSACGSFVGEVREGLHLVDELGESRRGQGADAWRCTHEARELTARAFPAKAVVLICDGVVAVMAVWPEGDHPAWQGAKRQSPLVCRAGQGSLCSPGTCSRRHRCRSNDVGRARPPLWPRLITTQLFSFRPGGPMPLWQFLGAPGAHGAQ